MKKIAILALSILFINFKAHCQITKGNWLAGGNARFAIQHQTLSAKDVRGTNIQVSPNLGYFFADKFAAGLKTGFGYTKFSSSGISNSTTSLGIGPFVRYYFLPTANNINLFAEGGYQYLPTFGAGNTIKQSNVSFLAGPVIFFNPSVGIEFTVEYDLYKSSGSTSINKTFQLGIGFQIHLEREKQ